MPRKYTCGICQRRVLLSKKVVFRDKMYHEECLDGALALYPVKSHELSLHILLREIASGSLTERDLKKMVVPKGRLRG